MNAAIPCLLAFFVQELEAKIDGAIQFSPFSQRERETKRQRELILSTRNSPSNHRESAFMWFSPSTRGRHEEGAKKEAGSAKWEARHGQGWMLMLSMI